MNPIEDYKCPNCSAPLSYDPERGLVVCENCGSTFDINQLHYGENGPTVGDPASASLEFNWGQFQNAFSGNGAMEDMTVYNCENCGAVIEVDANTTATKCPYCDSNVILSARVSGGLKPNAIIPFKITSKDLPDAVNRFYGDKKLLPKNFFNRNELSKVQGIYIPFWLYNCTVDGPAEFAGTRTRMFRQGDYNVTETAHYRIVRDAHMAFQNIPCDASTKMANDLMDSVEPYDFSELREFNGAYLTGYLAERFDSTPDKELERASGRLMKSATDVINSTVSGYENVYFTSNGMRITSADVKYALLPVYLFSCKYEGVDYRYAMNGQTGKIVGDLPVSDSKKRGYFWKTFGIVFAIVFILGVLFTLLR
ncbi:MAG: hypothetical protein IJM76_10240 [Lachnospiraceae bacterium]|nr:hypothetical protein [Lachnospiraceae bacterium]MBR0517207.1 hypothetical protein [Bacillota bacterium]